MTTHEGVQAVVESETLEILKGKGLMTSDSLSNDWEFLNEGLDSLDLATLLIILEDKIGVDPFRQGFKSFSTIGELVELYRSSLE